MEYHTVLVHTKDFELCLAGCSLTPTSGGRGGIKT
jgi:hypothetical protein